MADPEQFDADLNFYFDVDPAPHFTYSKKLGKHYKKFKNHLYIFSLSISTFKRTV